MTSALDIFGELTFNKKVMVEKLNKDTYEKLIDSIENGASLEKEIAADVAHAMKEWALENGATHFTHWFQPLRGNTAEKHDTFLNYNGAGELIERFSAEQLIQSEPDASSFPSGGIRATFEARGYTAWDPTSPAFLMESGKTKTLVIPSVFLSWTGEILDKKTPLLRSINALQTAAMRIQKLLGNRRARRIIVYGGPEQEYFLLNPDLCNTRPDLLVTNRTLFGAAPAKGQQLEDHYFGAIKDEVISFMEDFDMEMYRHGIPAKTRHNEVAPNQFEIAPLYEEMNLVTDHNLLLMNLMHHVAAQHGLVAVVHEKPFAGVNGSGKHLNWSVGDNTGENYLEPSKSPLKNVTFLLTVGALLIGVKEFGHLIRTSVADAGNDHRLGANEAPPAIMSVYLGQYLSDILDEIEGVGTLDAKKLDHITLGVRNLPKVAKDYSDRNRTSPIAFTGNKFEFRAVGSSANVGYPATVINALMAYGYDVLYDKLSKKSGDAKKNAILILKDVFKDTKAVRFEGDNYTEEWHSEAKKRGLRNRRNTPAALEDLMEKKTADLFKKYGIFTEKELHSKYEIHLHEYTVVKDIELKLAIDMATTLYLPAILNNIEVVASAASLSSQAGVTTPGIQKQLKMLNGLYEDLQNAIESLEKALATCSNTADLLKRAHAYGSVGVDSLAAVRAIVDAAERVVADDFWPVAKYQELLLTL